MPRILSISGLRGTLGGAEGLDPIFASEFAAAVGTLAGGGAMVVSRDGRESGIMFKQAVMAGLMSVGCDVLDADICTTPTCGVLVTHLQAAGGLQITASHNPIEWNGLKPFTSGGSVYDAALGEKLLDILKRRAFAFQPHHKIGKVIALKETLKPHVERVMGLIDGAAIRDRRFKVVLDCNHGSGAMAGPAFLRGLGCDVVVLGGEADGRFEHTPEPLAENLIELSDVVKQTGADVGFAQDPDADRLAIVDEQGRYIGEELTLALGVDYVLARRPGSVVVNGSTSRVSADLCQRYGVPFYRSAVGEANVVAMMKDKQAEIGGEGNGGVIEPRVGYVRDSLVSMGYVLAGLAERGGRLSEWVEELPKYAIVKQKLTCPADQVELACLALKENFPDAVASQGDGLRLDWENRWVQVRASNTEPILRVIAEANSLEAAQSLADEAMSHVKKAVRV